MHTETEERSGFGLTGGFGWPIGGVVAGVLGAAAFGLLVWLVDPQAIQAAIPALYGFEPAGVVGWAIHLVHGAVLGLLFAFAVTRPPVLGVLRTDVETPFLSTLGLPARLALAGFAYGLAIWAILPVLALPVWLEAVAAEPAAQFPAIALEGLAGHVLFGVVLGLAFAAVMDLSGRSSTDPLEE